MYSCLEAVGEQLVRDYFSEPYPLDFIKRDLVAGAVV